MEYARFYNELLPDSFLTDNTRKIYIEYIGYFRPKNASSPWRLFDVYQLNKETGTREIEAFQFVSQNGGNNRLVSGLIEAGYEIEFVNGSGGLSGYGKGKKILFREIKCHPQF